MVWVSDGAATYLGLLAVEVADRDAPRLARLAIARDGGTEQADPCVHELGRVGPRRAKVDQLQALVALAVQKVGPVRVRLHQAPLEQLAQAQIHHRQADAVARRSVELHNFGQRPAAHKLGRQHTGGAQRINDTRHLEAQRFGCTASSVDVRTEAATHLGLARVVALLLELFLQHAHAVFQKQAFRQQRRGHQQPLDVRQVGRDRVSHTGELHLDRHALARHIRLRRERVGEHGTVHLPDRRRGKRPLVKRRKRRTPVVSELGAHHTLQLPCRHVVRTVLHTQHHLLDLRREHVAILNAQELAELERRATHRAQLIHQSVHVGLRQERRRTSRRVRRTRRAAQILARRAPCEASAQTSIMQ